MSYLLDLFLPNPVLDPNSLQSRGVANHSPFDGILSLYRYHPPLSTYLHQIKYEFKYTLADRLSTIAASELHQNYKNILTYWQKNSFILLPVPLHPIRQNWRGFNQSEVILTYLSKKLNLPYQSNLLIRSVYTRPQVKLDDFSRQLHFYHKNVFALNQVPSPANYILFDDVTTTASTLLACIKPLLPYCVKKPWALTIAG